MEDPSGSESVLGPPLPLAEKRDCTELGGNSELAPKRIKMRHLESLYRFGANSIKENHYAEESFLRKETTDRLHLDIEETSQITQEPSTTISDAFQTITTGGNEHSFLEEATRLSLGNVNVAPNSFDLNAKAHAANNSMHGEALLHVDDISKPSLLAKHQKDHGGNFTASRGTGLDLNATDVSSSVDQESIFPYEIYGHVKSREASECGSSTGPLEENDSLKLWKEMKQNGFLSSSHGGIPVPKQRGRKSKNDVLKKKMELAKREQVNRFTKIAAPSGLLNELNPGIINHVRNSKQVHSIIEALVRSEKLENGHIQRRSESHLKRGKEINDRKKDPENVHDSGISQPNHSHENEPSNTISGSRQPPLSLDKQTVSLSSDHKVGHDETYVVERKIHDKISGALNFTSECADSALTIKLSSATNVASEDNSSVSNEEPVNQASVSSLSVKAATVASQWLELLYQDIRGRLAALRRSRKRVRAVIQTELPFLMSKEFSSNNENDPYLRQSSTDGHPNIASLEMHQAKWTALFDQMENALAEEGKHLEHWLYQVKEMQLHCEQGLQCVNWFTANGLPQVGGSDIESRLRKADYSERELAIRAAAASIYSTCNFVMSTENVSCF
ncbi:PREDICTED: uncharacterized protein LOC104594488 isoform X2 [Nelumbo nucifera]|uniref:Uncharacterized protein LOC104594488 isoform X2 n=2 Tax=Nelumbo nucifera TaxID=4432 RepID=A0A1U7ZVM2_NELNU|nr:PREDICTED: uncharacterized protein LOC104594488 isoform X2 [Nelumbo nucifera]